MLFINEFSPFAIPNHSSPMSMSMHSLTDGRQDSRTDGRQDGQTEADGRTERRTEADGPSNGLEGIT